MGIENNFFNPPANKQEMRPGEKLEESRKKIWEKAKKLLSGFGLDFSSESGREKEEEIVDRIQEIEVMEKGEEYDDGDDNLFLETEIDYQGKPVVFKMVAQSDPNYDPGYKIDYAKETPDYQKEAERRLLREAVINQKLAKFGASISADTILDAETKVGQDMYFVKSKAESTKEIADFGYEEGKQLAVSMFSLQYETDSSAIVNEIMKERGYNSQYELENEFSEDIFNDFQGYLDNSEAILNDCVADKIIKKTDAKKIFAEMKKYQSVIDSCQMQKNEYSIAHNNAFLDNISVSPEGKILLSDWSNVGTTQNRELSLVNDLGQTMKSARENLSEENADAFLKGLEDELLSCYKKKDKEEVAQAIIRLARLRTFREL